MVTKIVIRDARTLKRRIITRINLNKYCFFSTYDVQLTICNLEAFKYGF